MRPATGISRLATVMVAAADHLGIKKDLSGGRRQLSFKVKLKRFHSWFWDEGLDESACSTNFETFPFQRRFASCATLAERQTVAMQSLNCMCKTL